jgi:primosomal protein N' (replication factor Y)
MAQSLFDPAPAAALEAVRVALPVPADELFDYAVPPLLRGRVLPGCRVQVPFGGRALVGVAVEPGRGADFSGRLRAIEKLIDDEPAISSQLLGVLRDAAQRTLCPLGIALATALPGGANPVVIPGFAISARGRAALSSGALRGHALRVLAALAKHPLTGNALHKQGAERNVLEALLRDGLVERRGIERGPSARVATTRMAALPAGLDLEHTCSVELARAPKQAALLRRLAQSGAQATAELARDFSPALLRALAARGFVELSERPTPRDVLGTPLEVASGAPPELTSEQRAALEPIEAAVRERRAETFLLHGVTGSGKTEVYLRAVAAALAAGRQALVLVPEITLTHQIVARLRGRFGDDLAVLHSGLTPGERLEQWQRLRLGATPIAVGARSALFAPLEKLGLIVIDEEHDGAYKNEEGFRYHARELAALRASKAGCPLVLGSATPALETRYAAERGRIRRLALDTRVGRRPLPVVELVDLAKERALASRGRRVIFSSLLLRAIETTLAQRAQTLLFLNRRGFSTQVLCFDCGFAERCAHCDIALVFHAKEHVLRCHYCDYSQAPPAQCRGCGAPETALLGLGTERLEEELRRRLPEARIRRLDRDVARQRGHVERVLRELRDGQVDVVIGTQMIAKGHDFPGVRLVGVIAADVGLHIPDFRAAERTFQLLTQVAGRAGRDRLPGRVIVQTLSPQHYAIAPVAQHDYEGFYAAEIKQRAALGYPPFGRLVHALIQSEDDARAAAGAESLAAALERGGALDAANPRACERLGPAPAPIKRLRGRFRYQLLVKGSDAARVRRAAEILRDAAASLPSGVQAAIDAQPQNML